MLELLRSASKFVGKDGFKGIRISTRPDYIDEEVLELLKVMALLRLSLSSEYD